MARKSEQKDAFLIKKEYLTVIQRWSTEQKSALWDTIYSYQTTWSYETVSERVDDMMAMLIDFWDKNNDKYDEIFEQRSMALKKHSWNQYTKWDTKWKAQNNSVEQMEQMSQNGTNGTNGTDKNRLDKIYIKKEINKEKKLYLDYVYLTDAEYEKLIARYWERIITDYIEKLNNWIWEKPTEKKRQNRNAYYTILNWLKNANIKELPQEKKSETKKLNEYEIEEWVYDLDKLLPTSNDDLPF